MTRRSVLHRRVLRRLPLRPRVDAALRSAFSLLEVILALAILAGSMAIIGEMMRIGSESARQSIDLTQAELIADSIWAEIQAGIKTPDPVALAAYDVQLDESSDATWLYSIDSQTTDREGLLSVLVTVVRQGGSGIGTEFSLSGWMIDPTYQPTTTTSTSTSGAAP